jgi:hypothetical protein
MSFLYKRYMAHLIKNNLNLLFATIFLTLLNEILLYGNHPFKNITTYFADLISIILVLGWGFKAGFLSLSLLILITTLCGYPFGFHAYISFYLMNTMGIVFARHHQWNDNAFIITISIIMLTLAYGTHPYFNHNTVHFLTLNMNKILPMVVNIFNFKSISLFLICIWIAEKIMGFFKIEPIQNSVPMTHGYIWITVCAIASLLFLLKSHVTIALFHHYINPLFPHSFIPLSMLFLFKSSNFNSLFEQYIHHVFPLTLIPLIASTNNLINDFKKLTSLSRVGAFLLLTLFYIIIGAALWTLFTQSKFSTYENNIALMRIMIIIPIFVIEFLWKNINTILLFKILKKLKK